MSRNNKKMVQLWICNKILFFTSLRRRMRTLLPIFTFLSTSVFGQTLDYSPSQKVDRTVGLSYYDTDYIYFENVSDETVNLSYELIEENNVTGWHTSLCTNIICSNNVPSNGELGSIAPGELGYIAFSLSVNETFGEGTYRFVIFDKDFPDLSDTITFEYLVQDDAEIINQPWAKINFVENVVTVLLKNPQFATSMSIYSITGQRLVYLPVEAITSIRLDDFEDGPYIVIVRDETDRVLKEKIIKIGQ